MSNAKTLDGIVLKGGFLLLNTLENSRVTQDIDFSIDKEIGWTNLVAAVEASVASIGSDVCEIESICDPQEEMSGKIEIRLKENQALVGVDASWEPINVGVRNTNILDITIDTYTLCHILADKYCVVFSPKRFRRTKDLYDIYNILTNYDFSYADVSELESKSGNTINEQNKLVTDATILRFKSKWENLILKERVANNAIELPKPNVTEVLKVIADFVMRLKLYERGESDESFWEHSVHK